MTEQQPYLDLSYPEQDDKLDHLQEEQMQQNQDHQQIIQQEQEQIKTIEEQKYPMQQDNNDNEQIEYVSIDPDDPLIKNFMLPKQITFTYKSQNFEKWKESLPNKSLKNAIGSIEQYFDENLKQWNNKNTKKVKYGLPETIFDGGRPPIDLKEPTYEVEKLEMGQLTAEQLHQIFRTGAFNVPSKKFPNNPYTWKLTQWLVKGRDNINESFLKNMSQIHNMIRFISKCIYTSNIEYNTRGFWSQIFVPIFSVGLKEIFYHYPLGLYNLFLGAIWTVKQNQNYQVYKYLEQQRAERIQKSQFYKDNKLDISLLKAVNQNPAISNLIIQIVKNFIQNQWSQVLKAQVEKEYDKEDPEYENKIENDFFNLFYQHLENEVKEDELNNEIKGNFIRYCKAIRILQKQYAQYNSTVLEKNLEIKQNVVKQHPFLSRNHEWLMEKQESLLKLETKKLQLQLHKNIVEAFTQQKLESQLFLYQDFIKYKNDVNYDENMDEIFKDILNKLKLTQAYIHVSISRVYEQNSKKPKFKNGLYYFDHSYSKQIDSITCGWRIKAFFYRYFYYSLNIFGALLDSSLYGSLGLRTLIGTKSFYTKYSLQNAQTGEIYGFALQSPVWKNFIDTLDDIQRERKQFEDVPDTAFFGKRLGRCCNVLYCYLILFFLKGLIGILILEPIFVIILSSITFFLAITSFFWFPAALLMRAVVEWIFYDIDGDYLKDRYGIQVYFPLICIHLRVFFFGCWQASLSLGYAFGILPITIILWFFFAIFRYIFRSMYDCLMYMIVCCCARVPIRENNIAWRVKGPGVGNVQQFKKIDNEDVYILMQAELEKIELEVFSNRIGEKLEAPLIEAQKIYDSILSGFQVQRSDRFKPIQNSIQSIKGDLQQQINARKGCFPAINSSLVKFTDEELDKLIPITTEIIQGHVVTKNMTYIWNYLGVEQKNWKLLCETLWTRVFHSEDILSAMDDEDIENRHEMARKVSEEQLNEIKVKMQEKVNWSSYKVEESAFKRSSFSKKKRQNIKKNKKLNDYYIENRKELDVINSHFIQQTNAMQQYQQQYPYEGQMNYQQQQLKQKNQNNNQIPNQGNAAQQLDPNYQNYYNFFELFLLTYLRSIGTNLESVNPFQTIEYSIFYSIAYDQALKDDKQHVQIEIKDKQ